MLAEQTLSHMQTQRLAHTFKRCRLHKYESLKTGVDCMRLCWCVLALIELRPFAINLLMFFFLLHMNKLMPQVLNGNDNCTKFVYYMHAELVAHTVHTHARKHG